VLQASGISKRFGATTALDAVDLLVRDGEIHALIGENGAGKSTLVNVLANKIAPDRGRIILDSVPIEATRRRNVSGGVAAVFQSPMLFERMSWVENLALGGFVPNRIRLNPSEVVQWARQQARELQFELPADNVNVAQCSINQRVRLEILRALSFEPRVLIFDEPTSVLAPAERDAFLDMLRRLRGAGRAIILVTHKLVEALAVADHITVLRSGRKVADRVARLTSHAELARLMVGNTGFAHDSPSASPTAGESVLTLDHVTFENRGRLLLDRISLTLHRNEVTGIAGVDGNGQFELTAMLAGLIEPSAGTLRGAALQRLAVIPQNRDLDGLILPMALWENLILSASVRAKFERAGWLCRLPAKELCRRMLDRFAIWPSQPELTADALSGGNRQRLMLARALASSPRLLVAHDLCRGMDLRATAAAHQQLRDYTALGGAVMLISSDLDEIFALCSRIYVISGGRLSEVAAHDRDPARLGLLMSGV
jgi:simple sugar transport system ATP-binding protein